MSSSRRQQLPLSRPPRDEARMTLIEHLNELRSRLFKVAIAFVGAAIVAWFFRVQIYEWLLEPSGLEDLKFTSMTTPIITDVKLTLYAAFLLTLPVLIYQAWAFVAPTGVGSRPDGRAPATRGWLDQGTSEHTESRAKASAAASRTQLSCLCSDPTPGAYNRPWYVSLLAVSEGEGKPWNTMLVRQQWHTRCPRNVPNLSAEPTRTWRALCSASSCSSTRCSTYPASSAS